MAFAAPPVTLSITPDNLLMPSVTGTIPFCNILCMASRELFCLISLSTAALARGSVIFCSASAFFLRASAFSPVYCVKNFLVSAIDPPRSP